MIPKYRAWLHKENRMVEVIRIDFISKCVFYIDSRNGVEFENVAFFYEINLLQSTGLKDRNGVEIFEGDKIIHTSFRNDPRIVEYHNGAYWVGDILLSTYHSSVIEIIGNKFEKR